MEYLCIASHSTFVCLFLLFTLCIGFCCTLHLATIFLARHTFDLVDKKLVSQGVLLELRAVRIPGVDGCTRTREVKRDVKIWRKRAKFGDTDHLNPRSERRQQTKANGL